MSSKNKGYCVAGIDIENHKWIRLISDDRLTHGALNKKAVTYDNGQSCHPLDIVIVPTIKELSSEYQPENVLIDSAKKWRKIREYTAIDEVLKLHPLEDHKFLLGNQFNYITEPEIRSVGHSLILVQVRALTITHPYSQKTKASFMYKNIFYKNIAVTDPNFYCTNDGWYTNSAILVMSLPDSPYPEDKYYKFIAKIFCQKL